MAGDGVCRFANNVQCFEQALSQQMEHISSLKIAFRQEHLMSLVRDKIAILDTTLELRNQTNRLLVPRQYSR